MRTGNAGVKYLATPLADLDGTGWALTLHRWNISDFVHTSDFFPLFACTCRGHFTFGATALCWWHTKITCSLLQFFTATLYPVFQWYSSLATYKAFPDANWAPEVKELRASPSHVCTGSNNASVGFQGTTRALSPCTSIQWLGLWQYMFCLLALRPNNPKLRPGLGVGY